MICYAGQYLRIDLTGGEVCAVAIAKEDARQYFLGSGYAAMLYAQEMDPDVEPLDPRNPVYVFNGLLSGTFAPAACRSSWCGRSPLTGIWNEANLGGHFGAALRKAGVDGLVISGRADHPVYIYVHDGGAEIRDATPLWGLDTFDAYDELIEQTDPKARAAVIGPAGENLVRYASVMQGGREHSRAAGRGGVGAQLGSKQVKAIVACGRDKPAYADPAALRDLTREQNAFIKAKTQGIATYGTAGGVPGVEHVGDLPIHNWQGGSWERGAHATSGQVLREKHWVKDTFCFACPIGCGKLIEVKQGPYAGVRGEGPEYETLAGFGAMLEIEDLEAIARANDLCNRLGLDTISTSGVAAFAFEAFENQLISSEETEGVHLAWGQPAGLLKLIELIAARRGAGDYLAEGVRRAAERLGGGASEYALHVKGMELPYHDPRAMFSMAANYATSNRGACHLESLSYWSLFGLDAASWSQPYERFSNAGAGRNAVAFQNYFSVYNPLGICKFIGKAGPSPGIIAALVNAATGWELTGDQLLLAGERIFNLKRMINNRLGVSREDDILPGRLLKLARPSGQAAGQLPDLAAILDEYYDIRGWLPDGRPSEERLEKLGLKDQVKLV
jgi:aldehyde:ferredoxin oxidoreductase